MNNSCAGRILVATRRIRKGELIFTESPAVVGPYSRSGPQCLQCFRKFAREDLREYRCPGCGYPMCGDECSRGKYHAEECQILARAAVHITDLESLNTNYCAITVLRLLLLLEREREAECRGGNVDGEDYLLCLAETLLHHNEDRRLAQPEVWQYEEDLMVHFLQHKTSNHAIHNLLPSRALCSSLCKIRHVHMFTALLVDVN